MKSYLDLLELFLVLAETGHFTRAAERMGISQSTLSGCIKSLEQQLGVTLFLRTTRQCVLTPAGEIMRDKALKIVDQWKEMQKISADYALYGGKNIVVAAPNIQCSLLLPKIINQFKKKYSDVKIEIKDVAEQFVSQMVRAGEVDFGICTKISMHNDLIGVDFYRDEYVVAFPASHAFMHSTSVQGEDLQGYPMIGPLADNPVRWWLDKNLAARGIFLNYTYEVSLPLTLVGMVSEGLGMTVTTKAVTPLLDWQNVPWRPLSNPTISRELVLLRNPDTPLSPIKRSFMQVLVAATA